MCSLVHPANNVVCTENNWLCETNEQRFSWWSDWPIFSKLMRTVCGGNRVLRLGSEITTRLPHWSREKNTQGIPFAVDWSTLGLTSQSCVSNPDRFLLLLPNMSTPEGPVLSWPCYTLKQCKGLIPQDHQVKTNQPFNSKLLSQKSTEHFANQKESFSSGIPKNKTQKLKKESSVLKSRDARTSDSRCAQLKVSPPCVRAAAVTWCVSAHAH